MSVLVCFNRGVNSSLEVDTHLKDQPSEIATTAQPAEEVLWWGLGVLD